jgi:cell division protein FtsB
MTRKNRSQRALDWERRTSRRVMLALGGGLALALLLSFFMDEMGFPKYLRMLRHARQLEQEITTLQQSNTELQTEISRLQYDPVRMEELARERLGYVRKGETVYQIVPPRDMADQTAEPITERSTDPK